MLEGSKPEVYHHANSLMQGTYKRVPGHKATGDEVEI